MREIAIDGVKVTESGKPYVIAEIGNTHNGSVDLCKALITYAHTAGASAVKLQKRDPSSLFAPSLYNKPYSGPNSFGPTYGAHREALEFDENQWKIIINHAKSVGITLFSTAFDAKSVEFLSALNMPAYKVASGCLRDIPLIKQLSLLDKPLIISTGGAEWEDVDRVFTLLTDIGTPFCLLHCTMQYPCEANHVNLRVIERMRLRYAPTVIGFSDHTVGTWAIPAAYQSGAVVFEKHFTSNRALPGPDHALSIEPDELQSLTHTLARIQAARGTHMKRQFDYEYDNYWKMGKGVYAARAIAEGTMLTLADVRVQSPADGITPDRLSEIHGKVAERDIAEGEPITWGDII